MNKRKDRPLLHGIDQFTFYCDMESDIVCHGKVKQLYAYMYYKILDEQYPNSKFILNIRQLDDWARKQKTPAKRGVFYQSKIYSQLLRRQVDGYLG